MEKLLLCTDLDRTLIPNGPEPESPQARPWFHQTVAQPGVTLVYVTGRDRGLVQGAIARYGLPLPHFVIADVGASVYRVTGEGESWQLDPQWPQQMAGAWQGQQGTQVATALGDFPPLTLQEADKQAPYKLSYYADLGAVGDPAALVAAVEARLGALALPSTVIWSVDEAAAVGLLDILPQGASKLGALRFLMAQAGFAETETLFAGDSGNDLLVLTSEIPSVLVANGRATVKAAAQAGAAAAGWGDRLYLAQGHWQGLNGNYSAGILEGLHHYYPTALPPLA